MLSHKHKKVFIHIPKTAGQSIELAFIQDLGLSWKTRAPLLLRANKDPLLGPPRLAHLNYREYVDHHYLNQELLDKYFTFSFVRNPYTRAISLYKYTSEQDKSFSDYICTDFLFQHQKENWFFKSQCSFICDDSGVPMIDFVGRFETIETDFEIVAKRTKLKSHKLPRRNSSKEKNQKSRLSKITMSNFTQESLEIVNAIYVDDFKYFYTEQIITSIDSIEI